MDRINIPPDELRAKYLGDGLSMEDCADHFGCSSTLIEMKLSEYQIPTRPPGSEPVEMSERELRHLYVKMGLTTIDIADHFDCHPSTVGKRLNEYGIPTTGANHGHSVAIPEEELRSLYVDGSLTTYELGERFECDPSVIERRLRWFGIELRHTAAGEGDWQYPYGPDWRKQRRRALERAQYRCERCGITESEHRERYVDPTRGIGFGLDVHHRVRVQLFRRWDAASVADANRLSNLEVLCQTCHTDHGDRVGTSER